MVSPGAPHGITDTHREQLNADLLPFVQRRSRRLDVPAMSVTTA